MNRKIRNILLVILTLALAAGWLWRYITMNSYYDAMIADYITQTYAVGDIVSFGTDYSGADFSGKGGLEGYSIRVDKVEIVDYDSYITSENLILEDDPYRVDPDKLVLVHITLLNENSEADGVMLSGLPLMSRADNIPIDYNVLAALNNGNYGVHLSQQTQYSTVIPYQLFKDHFRPSTWRNLETQSFYLQVTGFPIERIIQVQ